MENTPIQALLFVVDDRHERATLVHYGLEITVQTIQGRYHKIKELPHDAAVIIPLDTDSPTYSEKASEQLVTYVQRNPNDPLLYQTCIASRNNRVADAQRTLHQLLRQS